MCLLYIKCKIKLLSEDQMEVDNESLGISYKDAEWSWKMKAIRSKDIWDITQYNNNKSIVTTTDGEKLLVAEPFTELAKRWEELEVDLSNEDGEEEYEE